jgi:hypothetical protein
MSGPHNVPSYGVLIQWTGDKSVQRVPDWRAHELIASGRAKPAYINLVYPPGSPPMAGEEYPPDVVRIDRPVDWSSYLEM